MQVEEDSPDLESEDPVSSVSLAELALAADLEAARRRERALARKLVARERDTLAAAREALHIETDRLVADIATDAKGAALGPDAQAKRARAKIVAAAPILTARLAGALARGRDDARSSAREDLEDDVGQAIDVPDDGTDHAHSLSAAHTLVAAWAGLALRSIDPEQAEARGGLAAALRKTPALMDPRVKRTAATETAAAFNGERAGALEAITESPQLTAAATEPVFEGAPEDSLAAWPGGGGPYRSAPPPRPKEPPRERLVKVWSAILDRRVCADCAWMHGTTVEADEQFPGGDPPMHPFCRCIFVVLSTSATIEEIERGWGEEPEAA